MALLGILGYLKALIGNYLCLCFSPLLLHVCQEAKGVPNCNVGVVCLNFRGTKLSQIADLHNICGFNFCGLVGCPYFILYI